MKQLTLDELLAKAKKPGKDAMKLHPYYKGKIEVIPKCKIESFDDFAIWYTPGVAEPCKAIHKDIEKVYEMTNKWNTVAVISNGTRVLGLGNIGPEAGLPVMEGKALLFKYLGGVDAFPVMIKTRNPEKFIDIVKEITPSFGGVNLEDIEQPQCYKILDTLREEAEIPVWHDDQQGTAAVTLAGLINALKIVGKELSKVRITLIGTGAANTAIARILIKAGANPENMIFTDSKGIVYKSRPDVAEWEEKNPVKWHFANTTNPEEKKGGIEDALEGADVMLGASKPGPGVVKPEWVKKMAKDAIVFASANPIPEIWPWEAKEAGARVIATGRSDFPNQVNNSLGFPGIFRGALDVRAKTITDEMCIAAAYELAKVAEDKGLSEDYIIPNMDEWEVFPREAVAVGTKAIEQGVARINLPEDERRKIAEDIIKRAREETQMMMKEGFIKIPESLEEL